MKITYGEEVGKRLRDWCLSHYESLAAAARALEMNQVNLSAYMVGRNVPGNKFQKRLRDLGCNIDWLMTGRTQDTEAALRGITLYPTYNVHSIPPASHGETIDRVRGGITLEYPARFHVWIKVTKEDAAVMAPVVLENEHCLISLKDKARSGDLVAARWGSNSAIRLYDLQEDSVHLRALSPTVPAIVLSKKDVVLFRVVLIKKY